MERGKERLAHLKKQPEADWLKMDGILVMNVLLQISVYTQP